jgi:hypothetical protein
MMNLDFSQHFLPQGLLDHFSLLDIQELCSIESKEVSIYLELSEKNQIPLGLDPVLYESKGFYKKKQIQDFPIRGKAVYLVIQRRRWRLKSDKNVIVHNDYSFISEGSKLTIELSDFLKGTGRDPSRYDK